MSAVTDLDLDLPALSVSFGRRLHDAGIPVTVELSERFALALRLVRPIARSRLYFTARSVYLTDPTQLAAFNRVFADVFGSGAAGAVGEDALEPAPSSAVGEPPPSSGEAAERKLGAGVAGERSGPDRGGRSSEPSDELPVPVLASDEEALRARRFDSLDASELLALRRLMAKLQVATPTRRARRARRDRHGERIDLRTTLSASRRSGGEPLELARRRRRVLPRRLVLLCDISGSMEPYARVYLEFLTCAASGGRRHEAFAFATRLTRLTRALHTRSPDRALQRAAAAAPDWSSGTRIGEALRAFNNRHGRRGMARGAVVVILSDGWERGDPALVGREMQRLARIAHRIIWVNPRASAAGFEPRAGGMAAALPHVDALLAGDTLAALDDVVTAIGAGRGERRPAMPMAAPETPEPEPWGSATPVLGSSVAMPSGFSPSRGNTTPGWGRSEGSGA